MSTILKLLAHFGLESGGKESIFGRLRAAADIVHFGLRADHWLGRSWAGLIGWFLVRLAVAGYLDYVDISYRLWNIPVRWFSPGVAGVVDFILDMVFMAAGVLLWGRKGLFQLYEGLLGLLVTTSVILAYAWNLSPMLFIGGLSYGWRFFRRGYAEAIHERQGPFDQPTKNGRPKKSRRSRLADRVRIGLPEDGDPPDPRQLAPQPAKRKGPTLGERLPIRLGLPEDDSDGADSGRTVRPRRPRSLKDRVPFRLGLPEGNSDFESNENTHREPWWKRIRLGLPEKEENDE